MCTLCHGIRELCVCVCVSVGDVFDVSAIAVMLNAHLLIYITFDASVLDRLAHSIMWSLCRGGQLVRGFGWGCFKKKPVIHILSSCKMMFLVMNCHDILCLLCSLLPLDTQSSGWVSKRIDTGIGVSDLPVPCPTVLHYRHWVGCRFVVSFEGTVV